MYRNIANLVIYGDLEEQSILFQLGEIFRQFETQEKSNAELTKRIYAQIKRLLEISTNYGFDKNLWHNYLTFLLITNENPFSITCEKIGANEGSVNLFAKNDFKVFKSLFEFDFKIIEQSLDINCFSMISNYNSIEKKELMYNKNVSEKVIALSEKLETAKDENEFFEFVT